MQMANHAVADQPRFISRFHLSVHRSVRKIKRNKKERERERGGEGKKWLSKRFVYIQMDRDE